MEKKRILVLFGGCSPEYGVSLASACGVLRHLDGERFAPVTVGITREGAWFLYTGSPEAIAADAWHSPETCVPCALSPNRGARALLAFHKTGVQEVPIDAAFPVLHGCNGEDGTVQGLCELTGIPLVGCGILASALGMDKDRAHTLVRAAGVAVPRAFTVEPGYSAAQAREQARALGFPLFVKPVGAGSSFGVAKVEDEAGLSGALERAFSFDDRAIVEEAIPGFEAGCAVMGNRRTITGEIDEIELADGFFDFTEKYGLLTSKIHVPARISPGKAAELKAAAQTIYRALGCRGFARVDMFLTPEGRIVFNEVNTIPGFTAHSRFPRMMEAAGYSLRQVVSLAIDLALEGDKALEGGSR